MFSIRAVCQITGSNPHLLRAWERRYKAFKPRRTDSGQRRYSRRDVERIKLLTELVGRGHSIQEIARFSHEELSRLIKATGSENSFLGDAAPGYYRAGLLASIRSRDLRLQGSLLRRARHQFGTRQFLFELVIPVLNSVGQRTECGRLGVHNEHAFSAVLRHELGGLLYSLESALSPAETAGKPTLLLATPEGDLHEFGILIAAVLACLNGFAPVYLGPNLPVEALADAAGGLREVIVVIGLSCPASALKPSAVKSYVSQLLSALPHETRVWLGGARAGAVKIPGRRRPLVIDSLPDFDLMLRREALRPAQG